MWNKEQKVLVKKKNERKALKSRNKYTIKRSGRQSGVLSGLPRCAEGEGCEAIRMRKKRKRRKQQKETGSSAF